MTQKNDEIYLELIQNQRKDCKESKKLNLSELKRISKNLENSIFDEEKCTIWNGYVTNITSDSKPNYINFYFRNRKIALHRLLYENYVDNIDDNQYLKYTCQNKGNCCNINHLQIVNSKKPLKKTTSLENIKKENTDDSPNTKKETDKNDNIVNFD